MKNGGVRGTSSFSTETAFLFGRLYERIAAECQGFAESIGLPRHAVADRMGALLIGAEIRHVLGESDSLQLRRSSPAKSKRKRPPVEVGIRPRKEPRKIGRPPKKTGLAAWWGRMTPAERSAEMKRRLALRKAA